MVVLILYLLLGEGFPSTPLGLAHVSWTSFLFGRHGRQTGNRRLGYHALPALASPVGQRIYGGTTRIYVIDIYFLINLFSFTCSWFLASDHA